MEPFAYLSQQRSFEDATRTRLFAEKRVAQSAYIARLKALEDQPTLGKDWSDLAERQVDQALRAAWEKTRQVQPFIKDQEGTIPGLFILGLGKLGGQDLNFSSDIDLVAFYDAGTLPIPAVAGRTDLCARVLRTLGALIDGESSGSFIWRTDWRLRPDPSVTDLAMSGEAGLDYFYFTAAPWRRLAMLKARVVAGDRAAGQRFLDDLHPFIWRRSLDFSMVEQIAHLKHRMHLEHPDLADARRVSHDLRRQDGFHLKLGRGGIRDIEFIANAKQLLWGGREADLQTPNTLRALHHLGALGILDKEQAANLSQAYSFFRTLENATQAIADQHIHKLPTHAEAQDWLTRVMAAGSWAEVTDQIATYRHSVSSVFEAMFADVTTPKTRTEAVAQAQETFGLTRAEAETFAPILDQLETLAKDFEDPEAQVQKVLTWLGRVRAPSAYLRALQQSPELAHLAFTSLIASPAIENLVSQSPQVLDSLFANAKILEAYDVAHLIEQGQHMVMAAHGYDGRLGALRSWINESLYFTYLAMFDMRVEGPEAESALTALAEAALDLCAQVVAADRGLTRLPFTVLALGRLGMGAMAPASDLDLIFVLDEDVDLEAGTKLVARFKSAMNAPLKEGRVYEIDTRLRPSGASGPPTLTLSTYREHQRNRAKTWEHLALTYMRALSAQFYGSAQTIAAVTALQKDLLARARDTDQWRLDCQVMLRRLLEQRIDQNDLKKGEVKLAAGGLMELEYNLSAQTLRDPEHLNPVDCAEANDLTQDLRTQRHALLAHRIWGDRWQIRRPNLAKDFEMSLTKVRTQTEVLFGEIDGFAHAGDHDEIAVKWA